MSAIPLKMLLDNEHPPRRDGRPQRRRGRNRLLEQSKGKVITVLDDDGNERLVYVTEKGEIKDRVPRVQGMRGSYSKKEDDPESADEVTDPDTSDDEDAPDVSLRYFEKRLLKNEEPEYKDPDLPNEDDGDFPEEEAIDEDTDTEGEDDPPTEEDEEDEEEEEYVESDDGWGLSDSDYTE